MADAAIPLLHDDPTMRRRLVTPEGVDLGLSLASGGQRMAAFLIDASILLATLIALTLVAFFGLVATGRAGADILLVIWLLGYFMLRNGYFILMEMGPRAATFGKRISGLRVVARDGGRLSADAVIARNLTREIEVYLPLSFLGYRAAVEEVGTVTVLAGLLWAAIFLFFPLFNKDRLRVGDLLAGTWVINAPQRALTYDLMLSGQEGERGERYAFTEEQLDAYGIYELHTLEQVLRTGNMEGIEAVSETIRGKIGYGEVGSNEAFLRAYYDALRRRLERKLLFGRRRKDKHDR